MPKRLQLSSDGLEWTAEVTGDRITLAGEGGPVVVRREPGDRLRAETAAWGHSGAAVVTGDVVWVSIDGEVFEFRVRLGGRRSRSGTADQDALTPPMSATVVRIAVAVGDTVDNGDMLIALEAMKMELPIRAPRDGQVKAIHCREGDLVQPGTVLIEI